MAIHVNEGQRCYNPSEVENRTLLVTNELK